jgi:hypothetical protein
MTAALRESVLTIAESNVITIVRELIAQGHGKMILAVREPGKVAQLVTEKSHDVNEVNGK